MKNLKTALSFFVSIIFLTLCFAAHAINGQENKHSVIVGCEPRPKPGSPMVERQRERLAEFERLSKEANDLLEAESQKIKNGGEPSKDTAQRIADLMNQADERVIKPMLKDAEGDEYWEGVAMEFALRSERQAILMGAAPDKPTTLLTEYYPNALRRVFNNTYERCMKDGKECHVARLLKASRSSQILGLGQITDNDTEKILECACKAAKKDVWQGVITYTAVRKGEVADKTSVPGSSSWKEYDFKSEAVIVLSGGGGKGQTVPSGISAALTASASASVENVERTVSEFKGTTACTQPGTNRRVPQEWRRLKESRMTISGKWEGAAPVSITILPNKTYLISAPVIIPAEMRNSSREVETGGCKGDQPARETEMPPMKMAQSFPLTSGIQPLSDPNPWELKGSTTVQDKTFGEIQIKWHLRRCQ